ncbi:MAG: DUF4428 domain-containing protein [Clostridia bacterium]|nr:DUF4428 domain-containing protein [Clostridia bacterium]
MGLFNKKNCDICGGKIGLMGNRKLDDGNMCKDCAGKLSPFTTDRRRTTLADIKDHLGYREANKADVTAFNATRTLGERTKVILDEDAGKFIVTNSSRWQTENPDVIAFSQVTGCNTEICERKTELKTKDQDGKEISYSPPRHRFDFDFYITIHVNSPWFNEIKFQLNRNNVEQRGSAGYREYERQSSEIKSALLQIRQDARDVAAAEKTPKIAQTCPNCGATTVPDANGCCDFCGKAMLA